MPGVCSIIGLSLTDSFCSTVIPAFSRAALTGVAAVAAAAGWTGADVAATIGANGGVTEVSAAEEKETEEVRGLSVSDSILFSHAKELQNCLSQLEEHFLMEDLLTLNDKIIQGIEGDFSASAAEYCLNGIKTKILADQSKVGNADLIKKLTKICETSLKLVTAFSDVSKNQNYTEKQVTNLELRLKNVSEKLSEINIQLTANSGTPPIHKRGPGALQKAKAAVGLGENKSSEGSILQSAHIKLEVTKEQLKSLKDEANIATEKQLGVNRRLQESLRQISNFKAEGDARAQTLEVLRQGLQAFGQLKEQWSKLFAFFQVRID
jgi:hypothetical protein